MRILMLAQFYPPTIGGEERHVRDLSIELARRGHDVAVATLWHTGMPEFECDQGVRIYRMRGSVQRATVIFLEKGRRHAPPFPDPEIMLALRSIIKREHPDIVHAHNWIVHSFLPLKAWSKAKLVVTLHDCSLVCAQKRFVYHETVCTGPAITKCLECTADYYGVTKGVPITLATWFGDKVERQVVDMFLPVSRAVVEATQLNKYDTRYRVIPNFVSNTVGLLPYNTHPLLEQLPKEDFLLFVGDVRPDKGVEVLLQAYAKMNCRIPLVLIGKRGGEFSISFPPNVLHVQSWPHEAVMGAWSRCTIALIPSVCLDACPTVAMEAMAMGRSIVASRIGGLSDLVADGKTGLLVAPNDAQALCEAIRRLLDDADLRERMGAQGRQRVIEFQAETVIPGIEQVYQEILQV